MLGFKTTVHSIFDLSRELFDDKENPVKKLYTYLVQQDYLEHFFSLIRHHGGWNDNPGGTVYPRDILRISNYLDTIRIPWNIPGISHFGFCKNIINGISYMEAKSGCTCEYPREMSWISLCRLGTQLLYKSNIS